MADTDVAGQTYLQRLTRGEQHVFWKLSFRLAIMILDVIAIGTAAWILTNALQFEANPYISYFVGPAVSPWILIVSSISFIFCLVCTLVLLLRRPPKPAHPGIAVGCDLVLWLAFIATALFATVATISLASFGNNGDTLSDPSYSSSDYSGEYYLAPNNTWVYNITSASPYYSASTSAVSNYGDYYYNTTSGTYQQNTTVPTASSVVRDCSDSSSGASTSFATCAEQDAYINRLWRSKTQRFATQTVAAVTQGLNVLLHFVLFVWACVDTHRRNRAAREGKADVVAEKVIRDMQARGLITVHEGGGAARGPEGQPLMSQSSRTGPAIAGPSEQR